MNLNPFKWGSRKETTNQTEEITIIYPPTVDWYLLYQRPQQLLTSFAKTPGVRSIFVTTEVYQKLPSPMVQVNDDLYIVGQNYDYSHLVKGKKVLWFSYPAHAFGINKSSFDLVVFDAIDNPAGEFADWQRGLAESIERADLISCTADVMYQSHKDAGKPIFMCPNGADYGHFSRDAFTHVEPPSDFTCYDEYVVGFYGAMATWVDYDLIQKIAEKYKVVMIGNNKYYRNELNHPNILNLSHKDYSELPNYLAYFDVALVPFKLTEMIEGCDPIKFYEYLSAGKPVIATELTELKKYSDVTYFVNHDNVLDVIDEAIQSDTFEKRLQRMNVARANSWDARAAVAIEQIRNVLKERN